MYPFDFVCCVKCYFVILVSLWDMRKSFPQVEKTLRMILFDLSISMGYASFLN